MENQQKKIFKRSDDKNGAWYLYLKDPVTGKFIRKTSRTADKEEALRIWEREQEILNSRTSTATLGSILSSYTSPETNPRMRQAKIDGTNYSVAYSDIVAYQAKYMMQLFKEKAPAIMRLPICDVKTVHIRAIKETLIEAKGQCRTSQYCFRTFKAIFSQAHEDGLIDVNPAIGLKDIYYAEKKKSAIDDRILRKLIYAKDQFLSVTDWAYFTVLATTGMRRSEALAISEKKIRNGILTIDSALKGSTYSDIGLPKWGIIRVIPLSRITQYALSQIKPGKDGRFFPYKRSWVDGCFARLKGTAYALMPEYADEIKSITPHVLRHSLNTNLLAEEASPVLVAYYLAWQHQTLIDMQEKYTHLQAMKLSTVSDCIDRMFPLNEKWLPEISRNQIS